MVAWCSNTLVVTGPADDVDDFAAATSDDDDGIQFARLVRQPLTVFGDRAADWRIQHWGCALDVDPDDSQFRRLGADALRWHFHTLERPPTRWAAAVASRYPRLHLVLAYSVPDRGVLGRLELGEGHLLEPRTWEMLIDRDLLVCAEPGCENFGENLSDPFIPEVETVVVDVRCARHATLVDPSPSMAVAAVPTTRADRRRLSVHWTDADPDAPFTIEHLQGALVVRVRHDLDGAALRALVDQLPLEPTTDEVLDLRAHAVEPADALIDTLRGRPGLAVVSTDESLRRALTLGGAVRVHESLDAALADDTPVIVRQQDHTAAPLPPTAGDITTVTAEDLLGGDRTAD